MRRSSPRAALAALAAFPLLWGAMAVAALPAARPGAPVLVVGGPFASAMEAASLAGGYPVGTRTGLIGQVFHSQDPSFLSRLREGGALLLLDAERLSFLVCGSDA